MNLAIIELLSKLFGFGLDFFVRNQAKKEEFKRSFDEFFKRSGRDSQKSTDLHIDEKTMKDGPWTQEKKG